MTKALVSMGHAGNRTPVFVIAGQSRELSRPFGASWDDQTKLWMYPAYYPAAKKVLADFEAIALPLEFSPSAQLYISQIEEVEKRYNRQELPPSFEFVTKPYAHQILGLCHAYYMLRAALFLAPGLGKSKIATDWIRLLDFMGEKGMTVVMGPLVTVKNWGKELDRHSGGALRWSTVLGTKEKKTRIIESAAQGNFDVLLVSFDTARNFVDLIFKMVPYTRLVADESQMIKDWRSSRCKAAFELGQKATRKVIMTGTPTLGNPLDLYGQYRFLGDYFMPESYIAFKRKFLDFAPKFNDEYKSFEIVTGYKNMDVLNARTQFIAIRKTKEECLDLPPQTVVDVDYDLSLHEIVIYNELISEMGLTLEGLLTVLAAAENPDNIPPPAMLPNAAVLLNKLLQVSSGFLAKNNMDPKLCDNAEVGGCRFIDQCVRDNVKPYTKLCQVAPEKIPVTLTTFKENPKLDALEELLDTILADASNKVIIWCSYRHELELIEDRLKKRDVARRKRKDVTLQELSGQPTYVRVDGTTGSKIQGIVDDFNTDSFSRVYLAQVSTGVGITLNAANYMIYFSLPYSLGTYLQSLDRNYRIGQTRNVTVYRLLGRQTVEAAIVKLLDNKVDVDQVLTQKLSCVICKHSLRCIAEGIKLFDPECVYQKNMARPVIKANLINIDPER